MRALLLLTVLLAGAAHADPLEALFDVAWGADMLTTLDIKHHPGNYEKDPLLGRHPDDARVITFFAAGALLHYEISHLLPVRLVPAWQYITIGMEAGQVATNYRMGIRFSF